MGGCLGRLRGPAEPQTQPQQPEPQQPEPRPQPAEQDARLLTALPAKVLMIVAGHLSQLDRAALRECSREVRDALDRKLGDWPKHWRAAADPAQRLDRWINSPCATKIAPIDYDSDLCALDFRGQKIDSNVIWLLEDAGIDWIREICRGLQQPETDLGVFKARLDHERRITAWSCAQTDFPRSGCMAARSDCRERPGCQAVCSWERTWKLFFYAIWIYEHRSEITKINCGSDDEEREPFSVRSSVFWELFPNLAALELRMRHQLWHRIRQTIPTPVKHFRVRVVVLEFWDRVFVDDQQSPENDDIFIFSNAVELFSVEYIVSSKLRHSGRDIKVSAKLEPQMLTTDDGVPLGSGTALRVRCRPVACPPCLSNNCACDDRRWRGCRYIRNQAGAYDTVSY